MAATIEDLRKLSRMKFSPKQVTLRELLAGLEKGTEVFSLKRSHQFPSNLVVWDNAQNDFVVCTHAFVVRFASPLNSGNFCPDGAQLPEGLREQARRREPSLMCQVSISFDMRAEPDLPNRLAFIEDWGKGPAGFPTEGKSRNPWNSPGSVAAGQRFSVASNVFQKRTGYNVKDDRYEVPYEVHPWVSQFTVPHNPSWIPNPNLVRVLHKRRNNVLEPIEKASNPKLDPGDVVTMSFKVAFSATGLFWNMSFVPIQIIRIGQMKESELDSGGHAEDHAKLALPRIGERLRAFMPDREQEPSPVIRTQEHADEGLEEDNENLADAGGSTSDAGTEIPTEDEADIYDEAEDSETESRQQFKTEVVGNGSGSPERNSEKQRVYNRGTKRPATTKNTRSVKAKTGD
ncbi:hypothetical protein DFP72DRAFT_1080667 [Ephemerocybe angulata]|uniref:Uncharacterized protein n=1 Tax=Ephemerocybe angulata TaxID=980116 RepID=A0A8H6HBK3_9AGAR|nr:hypothetical protein DFP72DRAFT_1080667 [Tulosesus angulatus]